MKEAAKTYDPLIVEEKWYAFWQEKGFFKPNPQAKKKPYAITLPPPNVTGALHMGHALVDSIQDLLIRAHRMKGHETLWVPGTDHAGIATQSIVERDLVAKMGKRKSDFTKEEFLSHIWAWKEHYEGRILSQLKKLGCSLDWTRTRFTMDDASTLAVKTMFKKMYDDGLIYRSDYLVNWDPVLQTAIADDEVEYETRLSSLWYIRYPLVGEKGKALVVATTRPETLLGDVAVAVSPKDPRYTAFVGKKVELPFTGRQIPILEDPFVDPEFGTGVVKITPAHDPNDYAMGERHNLELINILNPNGTLNERGGPFASLTMEEARLAIVKELKALNLLEKVEPHEHRVGISYRSKAVIEPYLSKQWFVKMSHFKEDLIKVVQSGQVNIVPKEWEKTYYHWIENLRDWCISRQLWWGHQIPIWYKKENPEECICYVGKGEPEEVVKNKGAWIQEEDVLDTWFSSALWPMTTLGWPNQTEDLKKFYPNATLITGHDILFFWVARMILMGRYALGDVPFHETFIHGLIYGKSYWREGGKGQIAYVAPEERKGYELGQNVPSDVLSKWEKMSKSKGNVIDPLQIIEEYGADAMRFALISSVTHARQIDLDRRRFEEYKNFSNKLWNAARFIFMNLAGDLPLTGEEIAQGIDFKHITLEDAWILSKLNRLIASVNDHLNTYTFHEMATEIYHFFWDEFCAYYLEFSKPYLFCKTGLLEMRKNKQKILLIVLNASIRLMHPIAPFITEEIFFHTKELFPHLIKAAPDSYTSDLTEALTSEACIVAPYPELLSKKDISPQVENDFALITEIIYALRNIRGEMNLPPKMGSDLYIDAPNKQHKELISKNLTMITTLIPTLQVHFHTPLTLLGATAHIKEITLFIPLPEELKVQEKRRLEKELERHLAQASALEGKLANPDFLSRAPQELVQKTTTSLLETKSAIDLLQTRLLSL